jgi:hypothetical protein
MAAMRRRTTDQRSRAVRIKLAYAAAAWPSAVTI